MNGLPPTPLPEEGGDARFLALHARSHAHAAPALGAARRAGAVLSRAINEPAPPPGRPKAGQRTSCERSEPRSPLSLGNGSGDRQS